MLRTVALPDMPREAVRQETPLEQSPECGTKVVVALQIELRAGRSKEEGHDSHQPGNIDDHAPVQLVVVREIQDVAEVVMK